MLNADSMFQVGQLHGIDLNVSTPEQALRELERLIQLRNSHFVCFLREIFLPFFTRKDRQGHNQPSDIGLSGWNCSGKSP